MKRNGRPRVLLVNIGFLPQVGGSYTSLYHFSRALPPGVLTVLTSHSEESGDFDRESEISIRRSHFLTLRDGNSRMPWSSRTSFGQSRVGRFLLKISPLFYPFMVLELIRVLFEVKRENFDLIWAGQAVPVGWIGWIIKWMLRIPYCTFVYGEDVTYFAGRKMTPGKYLLLQALKSADLIVANSESTKRKTLDLCEEWDISIRTDRFPVITPGVDTDFFKPSEERSEIRKKHGVEGRPTLITVSRLTFQKGIDRVVRAMPAILDLFPDAVYIIRGDGPHRRELQYMIEDAGLAGHVRFLDPVRYEDLPAVYSMGDLFVLPCREVETTGEIEGFGTVFLEAAACGLPVIGGRSGGVEEAVEDGVTGFLVDPEDDEDLRGKIIGILRNRPLAKEMGLRGRDRVVKEFGWEDRSVELWGYMSDIIEPYRFP